MNNRFVVKISVLKLIDQKKYASKYAIPDKPGPCFLQYHIAMAKMFRENSQNFKELILRDESKSPIVHNEGGVKKTDFEILDILDFRKLSQLLSSLIKTLVSLTSTISWNNISKQISSCDL